MNTLKSAALVAAMAATFATGPVSAYEAGDFIARAGWAHLEPDDSADDFSNLPGTSVKVDSADTLGISFSYLVTDHIGVGLLGVYPFTVDIEGDKGALANDDKVADTKALPPTLTLQYLFDTGPDFHPYIGAGINYTYFWDESTKNNSTLGGSSVDLRTAGAWRVSWASTTPSPMTTCSARRSGTSTSKPRPDRRVCWVTRRSRARRMSTSIPGYSCSVSEKNSERYTRRQRSPDRCLFT